MKFFLQQPNQHERNEHIKIQMQYSKCQNQLETLCFMPKALNFTPY